MPTGQRRCFVLAVLSHPSRVKRPSRAGLHTRFAAAAILEPFCRWPCRQPAAPQLRFIDFGATEDNHHLPFALKIANDGEAVLVDEILVRTTDENIIGDVRGTNRPTSMQMAVALMDPTARDGRKRAPAAGR